MNIINRTTWGKTIYERAEIYCEDIKTFLQNPENFNLTSQSLEDYILGINGCESWNNLPSTSVSNINKNFYYLLEHGEKIGFIDTGVIFKKGKSGVLFCNNGIIIKPIMGSENMYINFETLCSAIIEDSGKYIIADNKFSVEKEEFFTVIDTTSTMMERFINIRNILLSQSPFHRERFCNFLTNATNFFFSSIKDYDAAFAKMLSEKIYRFTEKSDPLLFKKATALRALASVFAENFDDALMYAQQSNEDSLVEFIQERINEFSQVAASDLYEDAKKNFENKNYSKSLSIALESAEKYPTADAFELAFESIYVSADEDNQYNHDSLVSLKELNGNGAELKHSVLAKESARISELEEKYKNFMKNLGDKILEKVLNNDKNFFINNPKFANATDKYGMNASMYAILFNKISVYNAIQEVSSDEAIQTNILGHTISDIAAFKYDIEDEMLLDIWRKHNETFISMEDSFESNMKWCKMERKANEANISTSNYNIRKANSGYYPDFDVNKAKMNIKKSEDEIREINKRIHEEEESFHKNFEELYNKSHDSFLKLIDTFSNQEITPLADEEDVLPEIPKPLELSECENEPEFVRLLRNKRISYINSYIHKNLAPKGEFEKTAQYKEREEKIYEEAEQKFDANINSHKQKCYEKYVADFNEKVNTVQINKQTAYTEAQSKNFKIELSQLYVKSIVGGKVKLGTYDADSEKFLISCGDCVSEINIPIDIASDFKNKFIDDGLDYVIDTTELHQKPEKYVTASCRAKFNDQCFPFQLKYKV